MTSIHMVKMTERKKIPARQSFKGESQKVRRWEKDAEGEARGI